MRRGGSGTTPERGSGWTAVPAPVLVLGGIVSVQCGVAAATQLFDDVGPGGAVLVRIAFAALLLLVVVRPSVRGRARPALRDVVLFGVVLAGMNACFYAALERTPLGVAVTIEFVGPLAVAATGSRRARDLLWVLLAAAGVVLLAGRGDGSVTGLGVAFALAAGLFWAAYIYLSQRVGRAFPGTTGLVAALIVASICVAPYGIVDGGSALLDPTVLGLGVVVALLSSAVPYSLELAALRRLSTLVFGVLMSLEPAMASLVGLIALGQTLSAVQVLAVGLVSVASLGVTLFARASAVVAEPRCEF